MKYILLLVYIIVAALNVLKFKALENILLESGFSWTLAKALPYIALVVIGILMARWFKRRIIFKVKYVKSIVFWVVLVIPFVIGFILNPIYEGDFAEQGVEVTDVQLSDFRNADLVAITIPDCPYCYGSIEKLKLIKKRNPEIRIKFVVCSSDAGTLAPYKKEAGKDIKVVKAANRDQLAEIAAFGFPTFVLVKSNKPVYKWSNDQFGARALDKLEDEIAKK